MQRARLVELDDEPGDAGCEYAQGWSVSPRRAMSSRARTREHRPMTCLFNVILKLPQRVVDVVLGPEEQIAYVSVTTRR
jgi:hypothetical protein